MTSYLHDMRNHAWALAPLVIGLALQLIGVPGAFVVGLLGTVIGVAVSCAVMTYETGGLSAAMVKFPAVLLFIACGGILGASIGSGMSKSHVDESERRSHSSPASQRP